MSLKEHTLEYRYYAFLRGVNVNGTAMKMAEVCTVFENAGMKKVSSVLATGNIIFSSPKEKEELKNILEKAMAEHFKYEAFLFLKDKMEVENILRNNPYQTNPDFHIYSFVGLMEVENILLREFDKAEKSSGEKAKIIEGNFYWKVQKGNTLDSDFGKILGRKNLKDSFTSRNINTIEKVFKKM